MNNLLYSDFIIEVEHKLSEYLNNDKKNILLEVMHYSTLSCGKRIRPLLVLTGGMNSQSNYNDLLEIACAIEMIHCYSLIHDDLPSIDNDDLRRGKLTAHKKFSEGFAILAGDALQSLSFKILSSAQLSISDNKKIKIINLIATAIGINGMAGGQALDIINTGKKFSLEQLEKMHLMKTGALIQASLLSGYIAGETFDEYIFEMFKLIANDIGLLYQIIDDILDSKCETDVLGKTANKDINNNKFTYVTYLGYQNAVMKAHTLYTLIKDKLVNVPNNEGIVELTNYIYNRNK